MAQSGLFVASEEFVTEFHHGIFTHFPDEEDTWLEKGLLAQELAKMEKIVSQMEQDSLLLMNESFAATMEYDACQIGLEILDGLLGTDAKVFFVTHNFLLSVTLQEQNNDAIAFLRAQTEESGRRTYQIAEGPPEKSAQAMDLWQKIME